jgi:hypothetical protein
MKKLILSLLFIAALCSEMLAQAPEVIFFLRNQVTTGTKYRLSLVATGNNFAMGTNDIIINYPSANLSNPVIVSDAFPNATFGKTILTPLGSGQIKISTPYLGTPNANTFSIDGSEKELLTLEFDYPYSQYQIFKKSSHRS